MVKVVNPGIILPGLLVGPVIVGIGVWIALHPVKTNESVYKSQRMLLGKRIADASAGTQPPRATRVLGVVFVLFGLWVIGGAIVALVQHFGWG